MPRMENKTVSGEKGSPPQDESWSGDMKGRRPFPGAM